MDMRNSTKTMAGPATSSTGPTETMLLDRYLPHYSVTLAEHTVVDADVATTWRALRELDLLQVHTPLLDAAFFVRGLPDRIADLLGRVSTAEAPERLTLTGEGGGLPGWLALGETAEREIVLGAIGKFWQPKIEWYDVSATTPDEFAAFAKPGWGRVAIGMSLRPYGSDRTLVSYEARTAVLDTASARKFAWYWLVIRPFAAHIMRAVLTTLRRDAARHEAAAT
jgi:hypothetical protein